MNKKFSNLPVFVFALLALLLHIGCSASRPPLEDTGPELEPWPPSKRPEMKPLSGELAEMATEMTIVAQRVRGLLLKEPLEIIEGTPELVSWMLQRELDELRSSGELDAEQATLEAFGFIPHDADYEALIADLYEEQVRGLYDHREGILLVVPPEPFDARAPDGSSDLKDEPGLQRQARGVRGGPGGIGGAQGGEAARAPDGPPDLRDDMQMTMFLIHEIVHALQDQHFGLERFLDETATFDESNASRALVEGDATFAMYEVFLQGLGSSLADLPSLDPIVSALMAELEGPEHTSLRQAPLYVRETLLFPYLQGLVFVHSLYGLGGWDAVNAAFASPPTTTQQVLRFARFLEGVGAERISMAAPSTMADSGYELLAEGSMGELGLRLFLAEHGDAQPGPGAACGWAGDAYSIFAREGELPVAVWAISAAGAEAGRALLSEVEDIFSGATGAVHFRLLEPDLLVVVTNLDEEAAREVIESIAAVKRHPPPVTPFPFQPEKKGSHPERGDDFDSFEPPAEACLGTGEPPSATGRPILATMHQQSG